MNPRLARFLTRLYPLAWRKRYGGEFEALVEEGRGDLGTLFDVAWSALRERIQPTQGHTVEQDSCVGPVHRRWEQVLSAIFCLAPMPMLTGAYAIACLILWAGWRMFVPDCDSPFGADVRGFANLYFQADKHYYCAAPVFVSWWFEFMAVRLRVKTVWLTVGLMLVAWMGAAARIQANRGTVRSGLGHISMDFAFWSFIPNPHDGMLHATAILLLAVLPYLLWRLHEARAIR